MADRSYSPKEIESVNEFLKDLKSIQDAAATGGKTVFYRGQSNKEWTLCPGIYRDEFAKEDKKILKRIFLRGFHMLITMNLVKREQLLKVWC